MTTSNEWMRFYDQTPDAMPVSSTSDATIVTTTASPVSSQLSTPQQSVCSSSRPARRRSRASKKKTPITLLNTNTGDFRALVQQFTGCPNTLGNRGGSGPLNLSFDFGVAGDQTGVISGFGSDYNYCQQQQVQQHQHFYCQKQQLHEHVFSCDNVHHDVFTISGGNANEGFGLENVSFQGLNREDMPYFTGNANNRNYFSSN